MKNEDNVGLHFPIPHPTFHVKHVYANRLIDKNMILFILFIVCIIMLGMCSV